MEYWAVSESADAGATPSNPAAMKPALVPAAEVARQGYDGLMAGRRIVIPGLVNKALVWSARMTPRAVLLPVLATAQQKKRP